MTLRTTSSFVGRTTRSRVFAFTLTMLVAPLIRPQPARPSFEVASIKPAQPGKPTLYDVLPKGRIIARSVTLKRLITIAYRLQGYQVTGGPGWISDERFDVDAKADESSRTTDEQSRQMLQSLLADRFRLEVVQETKDAPIYHLATVKNGPHLSPDQSPPQPSPPMPGRLLPRGAMRMGVGVATGSAVKISALVSFLSGTLGRPVIDHTNLTGLYEVELHWTPDQIPNDLPPDTVLPPSDGPSLFTALQEQMGLKLESATGPVEFVLIRRAERPSEN
jgi:bla regulator protein BlaR1